MTINSMQELRALLKTQGSADSNHLQDFTTCTDRAGALGAPGRVFYSVVTLVSESSSCEVYMCPANDEGLLEFVNQGMASNEEDDEEEDEGSLWDWVVSYVCTNGISIASTCHG